MSRTNVVYTAGAATGPVAGTPPGAGQKHDSMSRSRGVQGRAEADHLQVVQQQQNVKSWRGWADSEHSYLRRLRIHPALQDAWNGKRAMWDSAPRRLRPGVQASAAGSAAAAVRRSVACPYGLLLFLTIWIDPARGRRPDISVRPGDGALGHLGEGPRQPQLSSQ